MMGSKRDPEKSSDLISKALLYGIVDSGYVAEDCMLEATHQLIEGGVGIIQLRAKDCSEEKIESLARLLLPICRSSDVPFVINDFPQIAKKVDADIVHVGQDDLSVEEARKIAGEGVLVGKSTHNLKQAYDASKEGVDYIGFGPIFSTPTKPTYVPIGKDEIREVYSNVEVPIFCIGGIKEENLKELKNEGAKRVVIVSGLLCADDRADKTKSCLKILQS